ncbi:3-(cis-5,6-dihydroxycyclohexa-1,3-dien-1-yl)propanoate dehydrogenase [Pigmentiphaga sp. NML080357]|nr:3-(cis-5,6-dihydroxycyclohexa-1,3-dien-1-yl)propanoate dehydrogenase [Pigmentiphaga sp. NML080357]
MSAPARPPEGGAPSLGEDVAQRQEGRPVSAPARPPEGGAPSLGEDVAQRQEGSQVIAPGWLPGQVALVTGAAAGIGRAVAERYLDEGAAGVVCVDADEAGLRDLAGRHAGRIETVAGDVRDYAVHERAVGRALAVYGRLDILVGNAGVFDFRRPLRGYTAPALAATMDELFGINLRGYLYAAMAAREALEAAAGCMIFTASVASFHAGGGGVLYTMGKHAVVGMVRQLALELAPRVRVNGVGPGGTLTGLRGTRALGHGERHIGADPRAFDERVAAAVPLAFAQRPQDHTGLYVLLASRDNARAVTGEIFMSDGGVAARSI